MQGFITTVLSISLITSILILLLSLIFNLLKTKISPKVQYWTWVLLFVGLLVPFRPTFGSGLIQLSHTTATTNQPLQETVATAVQSKPDLLSDILGLPWWTILATMWLIGILVYLGKHALSYYQFRKLVKRWGTDIQDLHILEHFFDIKERFGIKKDLKLIHYPAGHSPMMTGFRHIKVLLPETDYTDEELELIFEHELTHYLHRDIYVNLLGILVTSLHWFNPIVRLAYKEIQEAGEIYCDYDVLQKRDAHYRAFYGETIITMIDKKQKQPIALTTCFYSNKFSLKRRITMIMNHQLPKRLLSTGLLVLIPISLLLSGSIFASTTQSAKLPTGQESHTTLTPETATDTALAAAGLNPNQVKQIKLVKDKDYYQIAFQTDTEAFVSQVRLTDGSIIGVERSSIKSKQASSDEQETQAPPTSPASETTPAAQAEPAPAPQPAPVPVATPVPQPAVNPIPATEDEDGDDDSDDDTSDDLQD
ncbi:M56 family metallopeptidase [Streptococcus minor]|uniref:M56 family metallopeptidase n=1 Tax=Streptococcus minor TaxID=229549 RepID=A0A3P1VCV9_9STRE|nr:M56 family metallopeptidase [Streptococcus minor]RRD31527.1 M56 family metallopeptidase [Streptococcus minor]